MNLRWHWNVSFGFCIVGHCHGYRQTDRQQQISQMHAMQLILLSVNSNQFPQPNRMRFKSHRYDWHIIQFERAKKKYNVGTAWKSNCSVWRLLFAYLFRANCVWLMRQQRPAMQTQLSNEPWCWIEINSNILIDICDAVTRSIRRRRSWVTVFFSSSSSMLAHKQRREFCDNNKNAVFSVAQEAKRRRDKCLVRSHGTHSAQIHLHCL